jgi:hypothetical protein
LDLVPELQNEILAWSHLSGAWGVALLWLDPPPSICQLWNTSLFYPRKAIKQVTWNCAFSNITQGLSHYRVG